MQWADRVDALRDDCTTITYDVRGHWKTGGSRRPRYGIDRCARDLDALIVARDVEQPIARGLSIAGCGAKVYAGRHPDRVSGLILAEIFASASVPAGSRMRFADRRTFAVRDRVVRNPTPNRLQLTIGNRLSPGIGGEPNGPGP